MVWPQLKLQDDGAISDQEGDQQEQEHKGLLLDVRVGWPLSLAWAMQCCNWLVLPPS